MIKRTFSVLFTVATSVPRTVPAPCTQETESWMMANQPLGQDGMWYSCIVVSVHVCPQQGPEPHMPALILGCNFPLGPLEGHVSFQSEGAFLLWGLSAEA